MIKMIVIVCMMSNPNVCKIEKIPFEENVTISQCQNYSQIILAMWNNQNPSWEIKKYRCSDKASEDL